MRQLLVVFGAESAETCVVFGCTHNSFVIFGRLSIRLDRRQRRAPNGCSHLCVSIE